MPPPTRRRAQHADIRSPAPADDNSDSEVEDSFQRSAFLSRHQAEEDLEAELIDVEGEEEELEDEEALASPGGPQTPLPNLDPPPSYLREISTLASWTVSSSKPGCSIPQLRHPSTALFWQSDGPQPHYLNIHFFKLVRIVGLRLYLDFEQDESYTPTRIMFLAGSGMNDLQEWGEMRLESPRGWVWADFSGVDDVESDSDASDIEKDDGEDTRMLDNAYTRAPGQDTSSDSENNNPRRYLPAPPPPQDEQMLIDPSPAAATPSLQHHNQHNHLFTPPTASGQVSLQTPLPFSYNMPALSRPTPRLPFAALSPNTAPRPAQQQRRPRMPVLRAHLVQIKIMENHQNGKDTHLRGLQIFARNDEKDGKADGAGPVVMERAKKSGGVGNGEARSRELVVGGGRGARERRGRVERLELGGFADEIR